MAFGTTYIKNSAGVWVETKPYFKYGTSGWQAAGNIYEKQGDNTTWTEIWNGDATPPGQPTVTNNFDAVNKLYKPTIVSPSDADTTRICIKISTLGYPTNPGEYLTGNGATDISVRTDLQADGTQFWLYGTTPGATSVRQTANMVSGNVYYVSCWAMDAQGNWGAPRQTYFTFPNPPAPAKTLTTKSAYVNVTASATWDSHNGWRTDNYVYQGGQYAEQGFWFYGTAIATLLKNAYSVDAVQIYIQRVNSSHGINGDGNIMLGAHALASKPSGSPGTNAVVSEYNAVDLARGEGAWVTITSAWYPYIKSGSTRGFGLQYGVTSWTSSYYNYCYGYGTSGGKLKLTWKEYV